MKLKSSETPWYIKFFVGLGGWLGAIFLIIFTTVLLADYLFSDSSSFLIVGLVLSAITILLSNKEINSYFLNQFNLALFLTGEGLVLYWIFSEIFDVNFRFLLFIIFIFQGVSFYFMNNYAAKFITSLVAILSLYLLIGSYGLSFTLIPLLFIASIILLIKKNNNPISFSTTILLLISPFIKLEFWIEIIDEIDGSIIIIDPVIYNIILSGILSILFTILLNRLFKNSLLNSLIIAIAAGIINFFIPGITIAITAMFLGFHLSNKFLTGLGIISSIFYISFYYYNLDISLISKSLILIISGLIALLSRWILLKKGVIDD